MGVLLLRLTPETTDPLPLTDESISEIAASAMPLAGGRPYVCTSGSLLAHLLRLAPVPELVGRVVRSVPDPFTLLFN